MTAMRYDKYIRPEREITKSGYKLICLPYAGGGATAYYGWQKYFSDIEILPVQLPGHGQCYKAVYQLLQIFCLRA